jgi:signal transduction histidine kinase/CheY-like chemotaxis protein
MKFFKGMEKDERKTASIDHDKMELNRLTLSFTGACAHLEPIFWEDYIKKYLGQVRFSLFLAILLYTAFGVLDTILLPGEEQVLWVIRFIIFTPFVFFAILFTYSRKFKNYMQVLLFFLELIGGISIILMIVFSPEPVNYLYSLGLILAMMFGYTITRIRFVWATAAGWTLNICYLVFSLLFTESSARMLISNNFHYISSNFMGMLACYFIEYGARRDFFLAWLLEKEHNKVEDINRQLERRVKERTHQLEETNADLIQQISERKESENKRLKLQDRLQRARKMEAIGTLAGGVAHDLNNVLSGMVSYPDLLLEDIPVQDPLHKSMQIIKKSGEKAVAIVQDLLTLARRGVVVQDIINLNHIVASYLNSPELEKLKYHHPGIQLETQLDEDLLNISGSSVHLSKTLMNLVSNAAEAMPFGRGGIIGIKTENRFLEEAVKGYDSVEKGEYAVLTVSDNGVGIASDDLDKIFEPFFTKKHMGRSGTGLGMAVVWGTIQDHGGYIDVQSTENAGTTFTLYFIGTGEEMPPEIEKLPIANYKGSGQSILVVDDVEAQREIAKKILTALNYSVQSVPSGEAAIKYLKEHTIDLVVLDMIMDPGIDGLETYRRILEIHPNQKAIIVSGFAETERVKVAQNLGAGEYVKKPYILEKIGQAIKKEIEK